MIKRVVKRALRHRLTHFFLIGAVLFAIARPPGTTHLVQIDPALLAALRSAEARKLGKASLSAEEARQVEARAVEDELLYREALRLRIDEGDLIVRQRLVQKLLVLAEDIDGASEPLRDSDLQRCFAENEGAWRLPATVELLHVVTSSRARAEALREQVEAFSRGAHDEKEAPPLGESFPTNRHVTSTIDEIERSFGADFASALPGLPLHTWSEPIESKVGWHLVRVIALAPERQARWEDVRSRLAIECQVRRREEAVRRYVARLLQEYEVYVGGERRKDLSPTNRTAPRGERSREDQ